MAAEVGERRAPWLMQLQFLPSSSVLPGQPFVWIMTRPPARHSKHLLTDWLINSHETSPPTIHCVVCSQIETTRGPFCQACSRSLKQWPTDACADAICQFWLLLQLRLWRCSDEHKAGDLGQVGKWEFTDNSVSWKFSSTFPKDESKKLDSNCFSAKELKGPKSLFSWLCQFNFAGGKYLRW